MRWMYLAPGALLVGLVPLVPACRTATEIELEVRTNVACTGGASWKGIAVYVGEPGVDVESAAPTLTSTSCDASGQIGSLVVVPSGSDSGRVGIRVVAGLTRNPEDCAAADYDGCIVTRRSLTYLPHQAQTVVIDLTSDCVGNPCDVNHTCVSGSCTDVVTATAPVAADGGVLVTGPTVRCGDDGTRCPASDTQLACCVTSYSNANGGSTVSNTGSCLPSAACPADHTVLFCDDDSDCQPDDAGVAQVCCESASYQTTYLAICTSPTACGSGGESVYLLCQERTSCPSGQLCQMNVHLNGYFECKN